MTSHIMPTYARLPVTFDHGQGAWLWDIQNNRYLDALAGISVCNLGHAHPAIHKAICNQSQKLLHTSNLYGIETQERLADKLTELSGMDKVFFGNSGAEANEAAIKLARLYGHSKQIACPTIIVMENSFHGRTMATLSATGNPKVQQGFAPLVEGFIKVPYNDVAAVENAIAQNSNIVAILVEPIQGEGGVNIPAHNYLNQLRKLCDNNQLLLMLDEIQTGIGRTGKMFAFQHNQIRPDVCTLAKALGNGVPIGACMASGAAADIMTAGSHGSTFGGNLLSCSAALAVLEVMSSEDIPTLAAEKGQLLFEQFSEQLADNPNVTEIRHKGMMFAIELSEPCPDLVALALENGLLINVTAGNTIRLLPPLIIDDEQSSLLVDGLSALINRYTDQ